MNSQQNVLVQSIHGAFRDKEFSSVFQKVIEQPDSLSPDEALMIDGYFRELLNLLWLEHAMIERGIFVDTREYWASYIVRHGLGTDFGRNWWSEAGTNYGPLRTPIDEALDILGEGGIQLEHLLR